MAVAGFIEKGASVADIGTDHGYLPVYLAQNGLAHSITASDISTGSLESARRSAAAYNVTDKITFVAAPGLQCVDGETTDTVVISGLGGETIAAILKDAPWTKERGIRLVLQPQSKKNELCVFLRKNGYCIQDAKLAYDNGRFYIAILAKGGKTDSIQEPEPELLKRLMSRRDPLFTGYMDDIIAKTRRALSGMKKSSAPDVADTTARLALYEGLKEEYTNADCE